MNKKNTAIFVLATIGVILFVTVYGILLPRMEREDQVYAAQQTDPLTHNIEESIRYKNKYMGNAGNLSGLIHSLPLGNIESELELFPDTLTANILYKSSTADITPELMERSLIYNATATFALIDNLQEIRYTFSDLSYVVSREDVEMWQGQADSPLINSPNKWRTEFQSKLEDSKYVEIGMKTLF